jgi:hypothetical protein
MVKIHSIFVAEILMAVTMKRIVFCNVTSCSLVEVLRRFTRIYCPHFHSRRVNQTNRKQSSVSLPGSLSNREDGDSTFYRNVGNIIPYDIASYWGWECRFQVGYVGFEDKGTLGYVFSTHFGFLQQFTFHLLLHILWYNSVYCVES